MHLAHLFAIFVPMAETFRDIFLRAIAETGRSVRSVSLDAGLSEHQLKNLYQGKSMTTNVDAAAAVASSFGVSLSEFLNGNFTPPSPDAVSVAGVVSAGDGVDLVDAYSPGTGRAVRRPEALPKSGVVAVEVQGDSMEPLYSNGDFLFYTRLSSDGVPTEALGSKCVCCDADDRAWVKVIKPGDQPGLFHLISLNPTSINRFNVALKWAAPVILHWPKAFAINIEP